MRINMFYFGFFHSLSFSFFHLDLSCDGDQPCVADFADRYLFGLISILFPFDVFELFGLYRVRGRPDGFRVSNYFLSFSVRKYAYVNVV
uniref:Uncharacterized protein n=1 Tax=Anopheles darlingi TaxID=43151 RepID=A0A2M4D1C0_ANODA